MIILLNIRVWKKIIFWLLMRNLELLSRMVVEAAAVLLLFSVVTPFMEYSYAPLVVLHTKAPSAQVPRSSVWRAKLWSFKCSGEVVSWWGWQV